LRQEVDRLFDEAFRGFGFGAPLTRLGLGAGWPNVELTETDKEIRATFEVPGVDEKDIEVLLADGELVVRGEKRSETEDRDRRFTERFYGRFERRIPLDHEVEQDGIRAEFRNGVLAVTLPKAAQAEPRAKRIPVHAA
jgi:HSP20 family protein